MPTSRSWHGHDKAALDAYRAATRAHDAEEELRLGYVAFTRAAHHLAVTSYVWGQRATPFGPSDYQRVVRDQLEEWGEPVEHVAREADGQGDPTPTTTSTPRARGRCPARARRRAAGSPPPSSSAPSTRPRPTRTSTWSRPHGSPSGTPTSPSCSPRHAPSGPTWSTCRCPAACPRPRWPGCATTPRLRPRAGPTDAAAAVAGRTVRHRFHAWVEDRFGQQALIEPDELPGRADAGIDDEADLGELVKRFEDGPFGDRAPHAVEAPFALVLGGQVVRGRIDAVYAEPDGGYLVVDWKTSRHETSDPLQLALYRLAWAELTDVPLEQVRAAFHYVRSGRTVEPDDLPDRAELGGAARRERLSGAQSRARSAAVSAISTISPNVCSRSCEVVSSPVTMWSETVQMASALRPYFAASV